MMKTMIVKFPPPPVTKFHTISQTSLPSGAWHTVLHGSTSSFFNDKPRDCWQFGQSGRGSGWGGNRVSVFEFGNMNWFQQFQFFQCCTDFGTFWSSCGDKSTVPKPAPPWDSHTLINCSHCSLITFKFITLEMIGATAWYRYLALFNFSTFFVHWCLV